MLPSPPATARRVLGVVLVACLATGCRDGDAPPGADEAGTAASSQASPSPTAAPEDTERVLLLVADTQPPHLTDGAGQSVYVLQLNPDGTQCDAACEEAWPPVLASDAQPRVGDGIPAGMVSSQARADGGRHATYNGMPLYRYAADRGAGRTAGDEVEDQWGRWSLVIVETGAPPAPAER